MRGDGEGEGLFVKASRRRANYFYPMFMFRVLSVACTGELSLLTGQRGGNKVQHCSAWQ